MRAESSAQVLVVGAGPTGLTAASELARRGVFCRIIDQAKEPDEHSRALAVSARTLETLHRWRIGERLVSSGRRIKQARLYVSGKRVLDAEIAEVGESTTPFPYVLVVSEHETEKLLTAELERMETPVERGVKLVGYEQNGARVRATLEGPDGKKEEVDAQFLIGCDGAHSTVRKLGDFKFEGAKYPQNFVLAEVRAGWSEPIDRVIGFLSREGAMIAIPLKDGRVRLIVSKIRAKEDETPTFDELQKTAEEIARGPLRISDPTWLTSFRLHHRLADRFRDGRVFLAGDAAHLHSPLGGQGMNTGIQDAQNLAWKLAMVLGGQAQPQLLDSYEAERIPVAKHVVQRTDRLFSLVTARNPLVVALRNLALPIFAPYFASNPERRARAFRFISQLGIRYRRSPWVSQGADDGFDGGPVPGDRMPDGFMQRRDGAVIRLHDLLIGPSHHLVLLAGRYPPKDAQLKPFTDSFRALVRLHVVAAERNNSPHLLLDPGLQLHRAFGTEEAAMYLVRPDGYVAFRCKGLEAGPVRAFWMHTYLPDGADEQTEVPARKAAP